MPHPQFSDETMSEPHLSDETRIQPSNVYKERNTGIFWDVEDYPIPVTGLDPSTIYEILKDALEKDGFKGEVTIQAYVNKNEFSDELQVKYWDAGIKTYSIAGETKYPLMIRNVLHWALNNPEPANLILLSKDVVHLLPLFEDLFQTGYSVVISDTEPDCDVPIGSSDWLQANLADDGSHVDKKRKRLANSGQTMSQPQSSDIFSLKTIFPKDASTKFSSCDTRVFWDIEDTSIFDDPFFKIEVKLEAALVKEGYYSSLDIWGYVDEEILSPDLKDRWVAKCFECGLYVNLVSKAKGAKGFDLMFVDILWFALNSRIRRPWNMLVISNNLREQDSTYAKILEDSKSENLNVGFSRPGVLFLSGISQAEEQIGDSVVR